MLFRSFSKTLHVSAESNDTVISYGFKTNIVFATVQYDLLGPFLLLFALLMGELITCINEVTL